ncbi:MAG: hypothetical protein ACHP79_11920 [Terriglobales bacterium]
MIIGSILALLVAVPVLAYVRRLFRFPNRSADQVASYLRNAGLGEMETLLDPRDEEQMELALGPAQFGKAQLNRIRLLREKLGCCVHNAAILQEWAGYEMRRSRHTLDGDVHEAAETLFRHCAEFRIAGFWIQLQLDLWHLQLMVLPGARAPWISRLRRIDSFDLLECYEQIRQAAAQLALACGGDCPQKLAETL